MSRADQTTGFHRTEDVPYIDAVPVDEILARYPTPVIVYSAARLRDNARALRAAMGTGTRILYSYKACYLPGVLRILHESGIDAEVCSGGEYLLARRVGLPPDRIAWNAVSLSEHEANLAAADAPSWLGLNTFDDIARLARIAARIGRHVDVMIRIQPEGVESAYLGAGSRLGFRVDDGSAASAARAVLRSSHLRLRGVHSHTQVRQVDPGLHAAAVRSSFAFTDRIAQQTGHHIRSVSIGGGIADREQMRRQGTDVSEFGTALRRAAAAAPGSPAPSPELAIEPGRYLVSDTAVALTRVLARAGSQERPWVIVDLGSQVLVPFEGREFEVFPAVPGQGDAVLTGVGDRMSSYSGVINHGTPLPADMGQRPLVIADVGAYTTSVAQNFMYGMPHVILLNNGQMHSLCGAQTEIEWADRLFEDDKS
jgi:diaminopimelate decarboxylase